MTTSKDTLTLQTHFQCKCQNFIDINKFIKKEINSAVMELLCPICERKYRISLNYEELE